MVNKTKIANFIYEFGPNVKNKIKRPFNSIKTLHQNLKSMDEESLSGPSNPNAYGMARTWLIDILYFGFLVYLLTVPWLSYPGFSRSILRIISFGTLPGIIIILVQSFKGNK